MSKSKVYGKLGQSLVISFCTFVIVNLLVPMNYVIPAIASWVSLITLMLARDYFERNEEKKILVIAQMLVQTLKTHPEDYKMFRSLLLMIMKLWELSFDEVGIRQQEMEDLGFILDQK